MSILQRIRERAARDPQRIVLPEGEDPRTIAAAAICARERLAHITVLGDTEKVRAAAREAGVDLGGMVEVIDHTRAADRDKMAAYYHELRKAKGMMPDEARIALRDPLYYGNLMVRMNRADGSVAGATNTTRTPCAPRSTASACAPGSNSSPASSSWRTPTRDSAQTAR
jgi:phosphate acetyltransferase